MRITGFAVVVLVAAVAAAGAADDRRWENPIFDSPEDAVAAAEALAPDLGREGSRASRFFAELTLAEGDLEGLRFSSTMTRMVVGDLLITHPSAFMANPVQKRTVERFMDAVPGQRNILAERLARFGYPELEGLTYLRLVESVDAFAGVGPASSDRMSQVGGVTYYCRYVVLPLSYVGQAAINELHHNPSVDFEGTIRRWQSESFANLVNTFRHEMVHVHTNTTLDVPAYSDRIAYPTWFHEGTATYLAADPHAGLSAQYREYQDLFFFLVQRYGITDLQAFFGSVLGGKPVARALDEVYDIEGRSELFRRSGRWHLAIDRGKTGVWIVVLVVMIAAFRGADHPTIGYLLILGGVVIGLGVATGIADHLYGLRGPAVVTVATSALLVLAAVLTVLGMRRVNRHWRRPSSP